MKETKEQKKYKYQIKFKENENDVKIIIKNNSLLFVVRHELGRIRAA